jgi:Cupin-like domain
MAVFAALRRTGRPVLLDDLLEDWPRRAEVSLPRLRERFADRRLPILSTKGGRLECDVNTGVAFDTMRFGDYIDRLTNGERIDAYLASPVDSWLPELKEDMPPPIYCRDVPWRNARLWLSAPGTSVPLHRDVAQNIFIQLVGRKRFLLYPPAAAPWLYSNRFRSALANYSRVDPERPDYATFPLSRAVQPVEVVLGPGDAMYLPSRWWHHVRSLDVSLSVNFWWADGAVAFAVRAAEFVKRVRGLEIYGLERRLRAHAAGAADATVGVDA